MTPRINDGSNEIDLSEFSANLIKLSRTKISKYNLSGQGSVTELVHPAVLKCEHLFTHYPDRLIYRTEACGYNILAFRDPAQALSQYPEVNVIRGFPWEIGQFLNSKISELIINFEGLGAILLSQKESFAPVLIPELHHYTLPVFLEYALSPELWGPSGKWTRFHDRLHKLFMKHDLLLDLDHPGFYPLKREALFLEKAGFEGRQSPKSFDLIMTWDFPLSGLVELENALAQEP